jgi:hypothetical protein
MLGVLRLLPVLRPLSTGKSSVLAPDGPTPRASSCQGQGLGAWAI